MKTKVSAIIWQVCHGLPRYIIFMNFLIGMHLTATSLGFFLEAILYYIVPYLMS